MYRCLNCGEIFDEPVIIENHLTNDEHYALEEACPYCHNYCEEIKEENTMSHEDIKKAVVCCFDCDCNNCPYSTKANCEELLKQDLFEQLNQYENEIERLTNQVVNLKCECEDAKVMERLLPTLKKEIRDKAIKEFAEMLKEKYSQADILCPRRIISLTENELNNLLKEMGVE